MQTGPTLFPALEPFAERYAQGRTQLVWTRLVADLETPVSAMLKLREPGKPAFLLESVEGGEVRGRYSIIGLMPDLIWRCFGPRAEISYNDHIEEGTFAPCADGSLESFRRLMADSRIDIPDELPPMAAGLIGYMSYDMVRLMERLPDGNPDPIGVPDACFVRPKIMVIFDSVAGVFYVVTPIWHQPGRGDANAAYKAASERISLAVERLARPLPDDAQYREAPHQELAFRSNVTKEQYFGMVDHAKEHIAAGDIFQVVLSQRFAAPFPEPPFALYRAIRHLNPSPFLFCLDFGTFALVGASPEILVRLRNGVVTVRPIAGTRKRGRNRAEDAALAADLLADPKELAEHLMLLDLGRNDVGRIARTGTVKVTERMIIELYSHVMHIVSNVEGEIDPKRDALDALIAGFPAGTVSGAPKIRAMEIIDDLEPERRGFYAGCAGYFSANGAMDTCISLRTALVKDGTIYVQAGGGIVADSSPEGEYEESLNKARAMMRAAGEAKRFTGGCA